MWLVVNYQCSLCHLHQGHSKSRCVNGKCEAALQCKDLNKHADEKKEYNTAKENVSKCQAKVKTLNSEIEMRQKKVDCPRQFCRKS
jgi:hypothetical protein